MPKIKCKRCGQSFFVQSTVAEKQEYCDKCLIIKEKIDAGKACPNCGYDADVQKTEKCARCGRLFGDKMFCTECHKEIMYMTDFGSSNVEVEVNNFRDVLSKTSSTKHEEVLCLACFKKANKPPDPETTDQKLDRLIECFQGIAEILRIIAGNQ